MTIERQEIMNMCRTMNNFSDWWTLKRVKNLLFAVLIASLVPIIYCSFFDCATGDDLGYSAGVHQLLLEHESMTALLKKMFSEIKQSYYSYQGTWASIFLFQLQPGIWGERIYTITAWIALFFLLTGTGYVLKCLLFDTIHISENGFWCIFIIVSVITIQYMPKVRGGLFWYTSVVHYVVPYGMALLCSAWAIRWIDTGKKRFYIPILFCMAYLGGAGYPPIVLAAVSFCILILGSLTGMIRIYCGTVPRKRARYLLIPLLLEMAGFVVSAIAPGNKGRGGEDFGFSIARVFNTILMALKKGLVDGVSYIFDGRLILPAMILIAVFAFEAYHVQERRAEAKHPIAFIVLTYLVACSVRTPAIYAAVEVSGGVPDVEFFTTILCMTVAISYTMVWLKNVLFDNKRAIAENAVEFNRIIRTPIMILFIVFCLLFWNHLIGTTVDYTCITFYTSGGLADFQDQMQERLAILQNDNIKDVVLPEMNGEQGPFMHMPLVNDPSAFTNSSTAEYYNKNSVVAIPRDEYERLYINGIKKNGNEE